MMKELIKIIFLNHHFKGAWVVENVQSYYTPLIAPYVVGRHWYWSNFYIPRIPVAPSGITSSTISAGNKVIRLTTRQLEEKLNIDLSPYQVPGKRLLLRNCVEPEVGLHILEWCNNLKQEVFV